MTRCSLVLLLLWAWAWAISIGVCNASIVPPSPLHVMNGEGFVAYLRVPIDFGFIENCWYKYRDDDRVELDLNATQPIVTDRGEHLLPFSSTICGVRVSKVNSASAAKWQLEAENATGHTEIGNLMINILPALKTRFVTHVERELGAGTISCSKHDSHTRHCRITAEDGRSWNKCEVYTNLRPNMTFECKAFNWGRMEEAHERIIVDVKKAPSLTVPSLAESEQNLVLQCQFGGGASVSACQAELPDHKSEIFLSEGLYNGRYSAFNTSKAASKCSVEIPKPLAAHELGLWRIMNYESGTPLGCLFYIGKPRKMIIEEELKLLSNVDVIQIKTKPNITSYPMTEISCSVPFVIEECYMRSPNNTVYFPDPVFFNKERLYGRCSFRSLQAEAGLWTCGVRGHDFEREVLQDIEVVMKPEMGEMVTTKLKAKRGTNVEFMCRSPFEALITHCAFIDPLNQVHLVATTQSVKTEGHVQYFGRGLMFGECGIKVKDVVSDDFGNWTCQFVMAAGNLKSTFAMQLAESALGHATSVGLGVGLTVVFVLVLGVIIGTVFYRRRNLTARHSFPAEDPLNEPPPSPTTATPSTPTATTTATTSNTEMSAA